MGAILLIFGLGIFGSTSYMAATCYGGVCPQMIDNSGTYESPSPITDATVPEAPKATPKDYYVTPNPAQF